MSRLTAFALPLLAGCADTITGLDTLRVDVRITPDTVVIGAPAQIAVTLRNIGATPIEVSSCPIYFWVEDPASHDIVGGSRTLYCVTGTFVNNPLRLGAFESKTITHTWTQTQNVPPGSYLVYGYLGWPERTSRPQAVVIREP